MFRSPSAHARPPSDRVPNIEEERLSHDSSASSAIARLQWRNHAAVRTPSAHLDASNPFDNIHLTATATATTTTAHSSATPPSNPDSTKTLTFKQRIRHFTWTWFTLTMATGGLANVLYTVPFRIRGLYALGCAFFLLNVALFVANVVLIACRFYWYPRTFRASFLHPTESLFIPGVMVSFGIICLNVSQYGVGREAAGGGDGGWLERAMVLLFWVDCGLAFCFSVGIYLIM